jgi:hypothetical protein
MTKQRFSSGEGTLWLACLVLLVFDIVLMLTPEGNSKNNYKSPWAVPIVSAFLLLMLIFLFLKRLEPYMGRLMMRKTVAAAAPPAPAPEPEVAVPPRETIPVPPFAIQTLTRETMPPLSPEARALLQQALDLHKRRVRIFRRAFWLLCAAHLAIALLAGRLGSAYPISFRWVQFFLLIAVVLVVMDGVMNARTMVVVGMWWLMNIGGNVLTAYLAVMYAVDSRVLLAVLSLITIAANVLITRRQGRRLQQEAMNRRPLNLLFLWVFGSMRNPGSITFGFGAVWRCIGTIRLLGGAGFMGDSVAMARSFLKGRTGDLVVQTPEELTRKLETFDRRPNRVGLYGQHMLLCNDTVWQMALHTLLREADVVLMDLRRFSPANRGATYELGQLIDHFPTARFALLADQSTDGEFLSASLRDAWQAMDADSPNRRSVDPIRIIHLAQRAEEGDLDNLAIAREGNLLLELMCERAVAGLTA